MSLPVDKGIDMGNDIGIKLGNDNINTRYPDINAGIKKTQIPSGNDMGNQVNMLISFLCLHYLMLLPFHVVC